jgi:hypothetical protein
MKCSEVKDWVLLLESHPKPGRQCLEMLTKVWVRDEFLIRNATE